MLRDRVLREQGLIDALLNISGGARGANWAAGAKDAHLEEAEHNVRVVKIAPDPVHTPEFALMRLGGDAEAAEAVYNGVERPLTSEDVVEVCAFAVNLPHHVNLDLATVKPVAQAAPHKVLRNQ